MHVVSPLMTYTFRNSVQVYLCPDGIDCDEITTIPRVGEFVSISNHKVDEINGHYEVKYVNWDLVMGHDGMPQRHWVTVELERID